MTGFDEAPRLFVWFGVPDVGPASPLMVVMNKDGYESFQPLMSSSHQHAVEKHGPHAQACGQALGVQVELREYTLLLIHEIGEQ